MGESTIHHLDKHRANIYIYMLEDNGYKANMYWFIEHIKQSSIKLR